MILFYFLFVLMMIGYAILIDYYHRAWNKMPDVGANSNHKGPSTQVFSTGRPMVIPETNDSVPLISPQVSLPRTPVSVIVSLRNEAANVDLLMTSLLSQDYPRELLEFILIDDHSTDNTLALLSAYEGEPGVRVYPLSSLPGEGGLSTSAMNRGAATRLDAPVNISFKKMAISKAIGLAAGTLIITTDADCTAGSGWITALVQHYEQQGANFIAAPVKLRTNNSLLSVFQSLDFITLQGITGASVYKRFHTMCNGANLAYEKSAFQRVNGFDGIDQLPSGDDMLLMYKIYKIDPSAVHYLKHSGAIVETAEASSWNEFFQQRIRWSSKAVHYDDKMVFRVLLLVYLLNVAFLVAAIAAFFKTNYLVFFLLMMLAKILVEYPFVNSVAMFFGQQRLMKYFPLMQPLHIIYTIVAGWLGRFGSYTWKGRKIITNGKRTQGT
jgi:cellulose synthase/poly-beta-1,6-N-acetylglucosamine synthase-like glycosyltransferase